MLTLEEKATVIALQLSVLAELACICPACFGPGVSKLPNGEPDVVVCMDCNFQQRRHLAASVERTPPTYPSLFIPPEKLESMRQKMEATDTATARKAAAEMVVSSLYLIKINSQTEVEFCVICRILVRKHILQPMM